MAKGLLLAMMEPPSVHDAEFNDWYDNEHLGDVLRVPGVTAAQRFRVAPQFTTPDMLHGYLAIYEIEGDDPQAALAAISGAANTDAMHISDALDTAAALTFLAKPISRRVSEEPAGG